MSEPNQLPGDVCLSADGCWAEQTLADLEQRVKDQIAAEYPDQKDRDYRYDNLTVPELLNMLSYMFS